MTPPRSETVWQRMTSLERELAAAWGDLGLPADSAFLDLTASQLGRAVCVTLRLAADEPTTRRVFVRAFDSPAYSEVVFAQGCNSYQDVVVSSSTANLYLLGMNWGERGGDAVGIYRVKLPGVAPALAFAAPRAGWFLSSLLAAGNDPDTLLVRRGILPPTAPGTQVSYFVSALDLGSGAFEDLAELPVVFA